MTDFAENRASLNNPCYSFGGMDARAVARAAGVPLGTFNVWVQRGTLPGIETGKRGRRRDIDRETAIRIAIFAEMVKFGVPAYVASRVVEGITRANLLDRGWVVVAGPERRMSIVLSFSEIEGVLAAWQQRPSSFLLIDIAALAQRVRQAEDEWNRSREAKA